MFGTIRVLGYGHPILQSDATLRLVNFYLNYTCSYVHIQSERGGRHSVIIATTKELVCGTSSAGDRAF